MGYNVREIFGEEQQAKFLTIKDEAGTDTALFVLCAYHDIAYDPTVTANNWTEYYRKTGIGGLKPFSDGCIDPSVAKNKGRAEQERWERVWGIGSAESPYTKSDYRRMDEIFNTMTARRRASGGFDDQQEDVFRFCARTAHQRDKLMALGDKDSIASAQKLDKMIQDNLAAENLRKRDEAPTQTARVDGIVEAIQKKYGKDITLNFDDVMEMFAQWMTQKERYSITQDAAEHAILAIINNTRLNSDMPQLTEMPKDVKLDIFHNEFTKSAERKEKEVYGYLQIERRK